MYIFHSLSDFPMLDYAIVTSGTFDGLHLGHQKIIERLCQIAKERQGKTVVITFFPHPRMILSSQEVKELFTLDEKINFLEKLGVDYLLVLPFTPEFSQMSPDEFVQKIYLQTLHTKYLVIGYDHRFGKNRAGGLDFLLENQQKYDFEIEEIPQHDIENIGISSTKIRQALQNGNVEIAQQYLGRAYTLQGEVIKGNQIGRTLGFPTANVLVKEPYKLIPKVGIYAVMCFLEDNTYSENTSHNQKSILFQKKAYKGMCYVGYRPTLENEKLELRIEVNIFDFEENIYGKILKIAFFKFVRDDQKFNSLEEMTAQIQKDKILIMNF